MLDLERIEKEYRWYQEIRNYLGELENKLSNYKEKHKESLAYLVPIYDRLKGTDNSEFYAKHSKKLAPIFLEENPVLQGLKELEERIMDSKRNLMCVIEEQRIVEPYQRFIALKQDEKNAYSYDLLELYTQEKIDLSQFDEEKVEFIINLLRSASCFIGYVNKRELPLLMNLLDECDREFDYSNVDIADVAEESYLEEDRCRNMEFQLIRARMNDYHLPITKDKVYNRFRYIKQTYFTEVDTCKMLEKLEERKSALNERDYKVQYYMILMLSSNIEEVYLKTPDEEKEIALDAYMDLSQGVKMDEINYVQYRTASPLINIEVLKRKTFIKRKGKSKG